MPPCLPVEPNELTPSARVAPAQRRPLPPEDIWMDKLSGARCWGASLALQMTSTWQALPAGFL